MTEIARHVTHFSSVKAEQKQPCSMFRVPCPRTVLLLADSSIPASSELHCAPCSNVWKKLFKVPYCLNPLPFFFFINLRLQIARLLNCLSALLLLLLFLFALKAHILIHAHLILASSISCRAPPNPSKSSDRRIRARMLNLE